MDVRSITRPRRTGRVLAGSLLALCLAGTSGLALAQQPPRHPPGGARGPGMHQVEPFRAPHGYPAIAPPGGWDRRPPHMDRPAFNHNFRAPHPYRVGPYLPPPHFAYRTWAYGDILPGPFWAQRYWIGDYWLFGLDIPPVGFEWVRYGPDALLIDTATGTVEQVVYGLFG